MEEALRTAGELPQVKMFKWRAHAVAVNATFENDIWLLEYYNPLQRASMKDAPATLRKRFAHFGGLNVSVENGTASVI